MVSSCRLNSNSLFFFFFCSGEPKNARGRQIGTKSNSFLGATVRSGGTDGPVLVSSK